MKNIVRLQITKTLTKCGVFNLISVVPFQKMLLKNRTYNVFLLIELFSIQLEIKLHHKQTFASSIIHP